MIIDQDTLLALADLKTPGALQRHLRKAGIPFKILNGRIITTEEALTASLIGRAKPTKGPNFAAVAPKR